MRIIVRVLSTDSLLCYESQRSPVCTALNEEESIKGRFDTSPVTTESQSTSSHPVTIPVRGGKVFPAAVSKRAAERRLSGGKAITAATTESGEGITRAQFNQGKLNASVFTIFFLFLVGLISGALFLHHVWYVSTHGDGAEFSLGLVCATG